MKVAESRACAVCGEPFAPNPANAHRQVTCGGACRDTWRLRRKAGNSQNPIPTDGDRVICPCGERFPTEYDRLGRPTTRRLCPECREDRIRRSAASLPEPHGLRRCADCGAWAGVQYGTATYLDAAGRCPSCADFAVKAKARAALLAAGYELKGGIWFSHRGG